MTTALIDADVLAYQAAAACEKATDWGDGLWTLHSFESEVEDAFTAKLRAVLDAVEATNHILAFTASNNWRLKVLPTYKGNRADKRKPLLLPYIRTWAMDHHKSIVIDTLEGDDVLGILATRGDYPSSVICSIDKDFKTIPGAFFDFGRDKTYEITQADADWWHLYHTLVGDTTDGYKGCPGVGDVGARKILALEGDPWENVVGAFTKAGLNEACALQQARVARICRSSDYDYLNNSVILWSPTPKETQ